MLSRAFNVIGLIVGIVGWKASLLVFGAKRSALAMFGYFAAAFVALGGMAILVGAGYVALEAIVGVPIAMAAVGVFLLLAASLIWIIANRRGKSSGEDLTEHETRKRSARDEEQLRSILGLTDDDDEPDPKRTEPHSQSSPRSGGTDNLKDPKVAMAAGLAMLGLLGPGMVFRTLRLGAGIASIATIATRAVNEHRDKHGKQTPTQGRPNPADDLEVDTPGRAPDQPQTTTARRDRPEPQPADQPV